MTLSLEDSSFYGDSMRKNLQRSYTCLTLFKPDINELILLFHTHLQEVEIVIDNQPLLDSAQLDQLGPAYQAHSLLARGQSHQQREASHNDPLRVELRMSKPIARLTVWKEESEAEPEMVAEVRRVLLRHLHRWQQYCIVVSFFLTLYTAFSLLAVAQSHHLTLLASLLLTAGGGLPLGLTTFSLLMVCAHWLKLDTRVFLFPGATETTRIYGTREAIRTLLVALLLVVLVTIIIVFVFRLLWR